MNFIVNYEFYSRILETCLRAVSVFESYCSAVRLNKNQRGENCTLHSIQQASTPRPPPPPLPSSAPQTLA